MKETLFNVFKKIMSLVGVLLILYFTLTIWESSSPSTAFWLKDNTASYSEDIKYAKEKLKDIGMNCGENSDVVIYNSIFTLGNRVSGTIKPQKVTILKNVNMDFKSLRIIIFEKIAHSCSSNELNFKNDKIISTPKYSNIELDLIKKNGVKKKCYDSEFLGITACISSPYDGLVLNENETVVSYHDIKTNLEEILDVDDTYEALNNNPLDFKKNFNSFSNDYQFSQTF